MSRTAAYTVLLAWAILVLYIYSAYNGGVRADFLRFFFSTEQSGIKFRAALLLGPFALTVIGYLISERARLFGRTLLTQKELAKRTADLEIVNGLLVRENAERKKMEEQLVRRAFHDSLTNLPNRALFMDHLQSALERRKRNPAQKFAVFFLDVDRFKVINDGLGHFIGDQLLVMLSQRLKKSMRAIDTVARFGGDEFAILMEDVKDMNQVHHLSERLTEEMRPSFTIAGHEIFVTVSVGIVLSDAGQYGQTDEFLRDADIAMYDAKARGGARHVLFDAEMHAETARMIRLETELRRAVERNEFILYYQPIIKMEGNEIIGFEALVRWQHPERGLILPPDFMEAAEDSGLIIPIGEWVVREACRQMRQWQEQFHGYENLTVSVNISGKVFSQPNFYEVIEKIISETGLEPSKLRLEIVESTLIEHPDIATATLKRLQELNIRFDIDDFGTGYSALNYLRHFPISGLKIDRSFIEALPSDKNNAEIVKVIIALARALNMDVIAEGIETTEQMELFRNMKGEYAQGFYIFRPMDSTAVETILRAR
ncbi:conserved hypothetical protein [Candidatus Sulfobium mesophilum]|uniref:Diguanylate cyclase n=1 Tax=Candidatus Sulfobium mesophilum TaxID=2016548 RepID=A0A2U3QGD5_9BACT|nr:conserved hypothetical protein [Candidatus Sulfobium mesophilum]